MRVTTTKDQAGVTTKGNGNPWTDGHAGRQTDGRVIVERQGLHCTFISD
jgi:hypothetical protein